MEIVNKRKWEQFKKVIDIAPFMCWCLLIFFVANKYSNFFYAIRSIYQFKNNFYETIILKDGVTYHETKTMPLHWTPLIKISKKAIGAIIVSEDGKFYIHPGYDIEQIQKVIAENLTTIKHKKKRGASTITQQLVKNIYLNKEKSISRKAVEFYFANLLEQNNSKEKILEVYLNIIEYGNGIYGIENASQYYFKKHADHLSAKEGAFLAMLLPNPKKYSKSFKQKMLTNYAENTMNSILIKMNKSGYLSNEEFNSTIKIPLSFELKKSEMIDTNNEKSEENSDDSEDIE
jgi:monofunctional biosynthetic peptidoglycan transglycosylase